METTWTSTASPPSFFRARIFEAQGGGRDGYWGAGYHLAMHVSNYLPYDCDEAEANDELGDALSAGDDARVLAWFDKYVPRCMALVPRRRREQFLKGVYVAFEEGRVP
jgi:hypothetical protein